jgi:cell volume regulation protein A|tara:strand:+ start:6533 stop:7795 length:1263 start_codon:yes stop_codon:yes gene_type:complete
MDQLSSYSLIILFSATIIVSYFFNIYAKKSGIPAVLMLIVSGVLINFALIISGIEKPNLFPILEVLGVVGLILIVLEAALDLELLKEKIGVITKSLLVATIGLVATSYVSAEFLRYVFEMTIIEALLFTIPLSILSSAIILPSIDSLDEYKKEFMIYESTFSDILGIVGFYSVMSFLGPDSKSEIYGEVFSNLIFTIVFSVIASYILIYIFQKLKGHNKLFLLISILLLLYAIGKLFHLSSLIIILIFGVILNNYKLFFKGGLIKLIDHEKVTSVLADFKVITGESAFVIRTFFFIIFGWSISLSSMFNLKTVAVGGAILLIIYTIRTISLIIFSGKNIFPQVFLAPRGLITILLFFAIPKSITDQYDFNGVLLFVIFISCIIMTSGLIRYKKNQENIKENADSLENTNEELNEETNHLD